METTIREFEVRGYGETTGRVAVRIATYTARDRLRRAVGGLLAAWSIALLTAFVPVAHFVLVPAFLALGVGVFFKRLRTAERPSDASGRCPDCGADQAFDLSAEKWTLPYWVTCGSCQRRLTLSAADSPK